MVKEKGAASASDYIQYVKTMANLKLINNDPTMPTSNRLYGIGDTPYKNVYNGGSLLRFSKHVPTSSRVDFSYIIDKIVGNGSFPSVENTETNPLLTPSFPFDVALDTSENIYWTDRGGTNLAYVRKLTLSTNQVSTIISPTTLIEGTVLNTPRGIAIDKNNNIAIVDSSNSRIIYIPSQAGTFYGKSMSVGTPTVIVTSANASLPNFIAFNSIGDIFWANSGTASIIRILKSNGTISNVFSPGGQIRSCYIDAFDNVFTSSSINGDITNVIFVYPATSGTMYGITATAGTVSNIIMNINYNTGVSITGDSDRNLYIASQLTHRILKVDFKTGNTTVFAGTGSPGSTGDGGSPLLATFGNNGLAGIKTDVNDNLYICDVTNRTIRKINVTKTTVPIDYKYTHI